MVPNAVITIVYTTFSLLATTIVPTNTFTSIPLRTAIHQRKYPICNDPQQRAGKKSEPNSSNTSLFAKFKFDDEDLEDDESSFQDDTFGNNSAYTPTTTFGAEAVPEEQRPANEYLDLISSPLFAWANEERGNAGLATRLSVVYVVFFAAVCYPISGATYTIDGYEAHKIASSNIGALGTVLLLLVRLYSGWGYIGSRLKSKDIEYEESGWYDGDIEKKTEKEMARDLFLYRQDVKPVEERLKIFTLGVGSAWIASCLILNVILASKPLFNQYDPEMLERLVYDEKVAGIAAQQSGGRPTYCDNRYYRAVANGGQGC